MHKEQWGAYLTGVCYTELWKIGLFWKQYISHMLTHNFWFKSNTMQSPTMVQFWFNNCDLFFWLRLLKLQVSKQVVIALSQDSCVHVKGWVTEVQVSSNSVLLHKQHWRLYRRLAHFRENSILYTKKAFVYKHHLWKSHCLPWTLFQKLHLPVLRLFPIFPLDFHLCERVRTVSFSSRLPI